VKPFRERNPIPIALIGLGIIVAMMLASFQAEHLPIIGGGTTYQADFSDAGGLKVNDDVRVAGVKLGKVKAISLHGAVVRVKFLIRNGPTLGRDTHADIKIKTLLGTKYLAITPDGSGKLTSSDVIPLSQTSTPLDVTTAFIGLAQHVEAIDTKQLAKAFDTLATTFKNSPAQVRASLDGLSRLSRTIASRDDQLKQLLQHARGVTNVLATRDAEVVKLMNDGDLVLKLVEQQRVVIHNLLVNTADLAAQLSSLVQENRAVIKPALDNLLSVTTILQRNQDSLDRTVHMLAPFVRDFTNVLGNGRWFDTFVADLPPAPTEVGVAPGSRPASRN
jgi:phospholipid/cholesterol/gamma-HCH transport system substrate-binding protein